MLFVGKAKKKISSTIAPIAVVIPVSTVNFMSFAITELVCENADFVPARKSF